MAQVGGYFGLYSITVLLLQYLFLFVTYFSKEDLAYWGLAWDNKDLGVFCELATLICATAQQHFYSSRVKRRNTLLARGEIEAEPAPAPWALRLELFRRGFGEHVATVLLLLTALFRDNTLAIVYMAMCSLFFLKFKN